MISVEAVNLVPARSRHHRGDVVSGALALCFVLILVFGPMVWNKHMSVVDLPERLLPPSAAHPFGTDEFGRDVLARWLVAGRLSVAIGLISTTLAAVIGLLIGAVAGYLGGSVDATLMRVMDSVLAFPALLLGFAVALAIGPGVLATGLAVIVVSVPWYARRVRSEVLSLKERTFIEAERVMGKSRSHVLCRHIVPGVAGGVFVQASIGVGWAILTVAGLGYIGLGVQPPTAEWGTMITEGQQYLLSGQWWISFFPGLGILVFVALMIVAGRSFQERLAC